MEESYETFEEELGPQRADPPPQKPVRQIRRPEMYSTRKIREEIATVPLQIRAETKTLPREPTFTKTTSLHKSFTVQNVSQTETPWENVTLNRCLFVAITILVLTSGFQKLHETLRGQGAAEEEEEDVGLTVRNSGSLRRRAYLPEPETSLWEVMFWWLPDLDDEDDEEEEEEENDGEVIKGESKKAKGLRGLRNKPLPDKTLMKKRAGKSRDRRGKKTTDEEISKDKKRTKKEELEEAGNNENEGEENEQKESKKNKKLEGKKAQKV
ncbi:junctional sarcoplasmic reticulum protein 1 [Sphaeramia orbicularis]|uniref:junctional sarcoplasmic reticulum protein 1 n=1 Tax=Sphaeramia orbicularis TaxID=375764 RepID=UPI00117DEA87|nr:junctional sarcoplasmic reticulum protein 1-like [Sphaeramia orbicularis]XP_030016635.1 junctional sarcoplasmic reticulum protein 1-like [Sphaeramia orbicularis]